MITDEELDYLVEAAQRFHKEAGIPILENAREYYKNLHNLEGFFSIVIIGKGFIVGNVSASFLQPSIGLCSELAWYVEPGYRGKIVAIRLLKAYEAKAIEMGASQIGMVAINAINPKDTEDIYLRLGYNIAETHYIKEI